MIPNCKGCRLEYNMALDYLEKGYNASFENLGKGSQGKHLFIAIIDNKGKIILS